MITFQTLESSRNIGPWFKVMAFLGSLTTKEMKLLHHNKINVFVVFAVTACLIGCSENNLISESLSVFPNGIFYLNKKESNDTLKFQNDQTGVTIFSEEVVPATNLKVTH